MAKYRQVYIDFWQDGFVLDLTPEEKYFYLYLMTNSKTTQCGIYELPKRIMETETGYNRETVEKLISRFEEYGKVAYHEPTREIMLINWVKYNWINSKKVISLINKELKNVKNVDFIYRFLDVCKDNGYPIDTLYIPYGYEKEEENEESLSDTGSIPYQYPTNTVDIDLGEERERELEEEREEEQQRELINPDVGEITRFWDSNGFGFNNAEAKKRLLLWLDDSQFKKPKDVILEAMNIACANDKRRLNYVEGILRNWENESLLTIEEIRNADQKSKYKKASGDIDWDNI